VTGIEDVSLPLGKFDSEVAPIARDVQLGATPLKEEEVVAAAAIFEEEPVELEIFTLKFIHRLQPVSCMLRNCLARPTERSPISSCSSNSVSAHMLFIYCQRDRITGSWLLLRMNFW
uniref:Uncharacterized protein n=1 Tax=Meloidogyne incognita TaxID=6306 RepID=A0A914NRY0_MELIC